MENLIYVGVVLLILSIVLYALGAKGVAGMTAGVGKLILIVGLILAAIFIILSFLGGS
jgi:uncharacterized membrane protein YtjA (UPF0391 family)